MRYLGKALALGLALVAFTGTAGALSVPVTSIVLGDPDSIHVLGSQPVDSALQGKACTASITASNNESVREGSDLIVSSDDSSVTLPNVEAAPNVDIHATGTLTLGDTITISVKLGREGAFSGGGAVDVSCPPVEPPTTTTTPPAPPQLAFTGSSGTPIEAGVGFAMLGLGAALVGLARSKRLS